MRIITQNLHTLSTAMITQKTCVEWKSESNWVTERIRTAAATTTTAACTNSRCTANKLSESVRAQQQRACTLSLSCSQLLHHQHTLTFQHCADLSPSRTLRIGLRDCALSHSTRTVLSLTVLALLLLLSPNWLPASLICRLRSQLQTSENRWRVQTYAQHHSDSDWIRRVCKLKFSPHLFLLSPPRLPQQQLWVWVCLCRRSNRECKRICHKKRRVRNIYNNNKRSRKQC